MRRIKSLFLSFMVVALGACGTAPAESGLGSSVTVQAVDSSAQAAVDTIDRLRNETRLAEARTAALAAVKAHPGNAEILWRASRAESDAVYLLQGEASEVRDQAAGNALQFAQQALAAGTTSLEARAQYAWAMGNATHLQPMFSRSGHARATQNAIEDVLDEQIDQPTALATAALLQYRLSTLPKMMKLMARKAPSADLGRAERYASAAHEAEPSRLNALILARIHVARDKPEAAADVLRKAIDSPIQFPRDTEVTPDMKALLAECNS